MTLKFQSLPKSLPSAPTYPGFPALSSLVYTDTQIPSSVNILIYYVFASWIDIFIYYAFAYLSISFHVIVNSTGARFVVHLFPEVSQSLRPAIATCQGMNQYFLNELMKTDTLMSTRYSCSMPPRHLQCPVPQIEFLTYPLPLHSRCTENFSALANVLVNHTEVPEGNSNEILHLPPPPSQPTFVLFSPIFQTWPLFFFFLITTQAIPIQSATPLPGHWVNLLTSFLPSICSTSTHFPHHRQGIFLKHLICHFPAYDYPVA